MNPLIKTKWSTTKTWIFYGIYSVSRDRNVLWPWKWTTHWPWKMWQKFCPTRGHWVNCTNHFLSWSSITSPVVLLNHTNFRHKWNQWISARRNMQLQCVSKGDTPFLHQPIQISLQLSLDIHFQTAKGVSKGWRILQRGSAGQLPLVTNHHRSWR